MKMAIDLNQYRPEIEQDYFDFLLDSIGYVSQDYYNDLDVEDLDVDKSYWDEDDIEKFNNFAREVVVEVFDKIDGFLYREKDRFLTAVKSKGFEST